MHEQVHCHDEATNHRLPVAVAFWIIWIVSGEECLNSTQNLIQIRCSTCSVILNARATQFTCLFNGVYPPSLTSTVKLSLFTHVHSHPLSLVARLHWYQANYSHYINNGWTFSGQTSYISIKLFLFLKCDLQRRILLDQTFEDVICPSPFFFPRQLTEYYQVTSEEALLSYAPIFKVFSSHWVLKTRKHWNISWNNNHLISICINHHILAYAHSHI